ncbi:PIG-L deacetylase family protein [Pseudofrankia inefficax]|uniref:LmbE family protein n=1 Tax=Pseudofrankia inefficax (strain DSM 45817 / CECT 9037 / DDB 130130 / EuI1c) TaxID=298654 RepID=E3J946_PSEI1|nr:PIG-L family deacetylase [Pseudofrankia inefficax]ADP80925.1 LmbE family protein [Pseudofrankia inefficax]
MSEDKPTFTVVSFHAHPDDEALLTAGTLARAAADGHRVVIVVATDGEAGLSRDDLRGSHLADARRAELRASCEAIGATRVHFLGYRDSGYDPPAASSGASHPRADSFASVPPERAAARLVDILVEEDADVLTIYDGSGGYGHPDHVQVHRAGLLAARLARTPVVLEATLDRDALTRAVRLLRRAARVMPLPTLPDLSAAFTPRGELTHRVDVRAQLPAKIRALRAHASQAEGGDTIRTLALLLRLPRPIRGRVLGTEWYREVGRTPDGAPLDDIFATLRAEQRARA